MENNYEYQKEANIVCLLEDMEYLERKEALFKVILEFEKANIHWGLSCSMNLFLRGLVDEFHDLDLIVDDKDISLIKKVMENMGGILVATGGNGFCESNVYMHYQLGRVDIDIIAGFRVVTFGTKFLYNFNKDEIEFVQIDKINVPLIPMEALYLLYCMMEGWKPKRRYKRLLISEYLVTKDLKYPMILEKSLAEELPAWIKRQIKVILQK